MSVAPIDKLTITYYNCRAKGGNAMSVRINAKFVRQKLLEKDLDQKGLAELTGMTEATVSRLLNGKPFTSATLEKLAKVLDCSPVDLVDPEGYPGPLVVAQAVKDTVARLSLSEAV